MLNTQLLEILRLFSPKELQELKNYANSGLFSQHKGTIKLLNYLCEVNLFHPSALNKKTVYGLIFSGEPYVDLKLRHIISYAKDLVEHFIFLSTQDNAASKKLVLFDFYRSKNASKLKSAWYKKLNKDLDSTALNSKDFMYHYDLALQFHEISLSEQRADGKHIKAMHNNLDKFYINEKLVAAIASLNLSKIYTVNTDISMLDAVLSEIKAKNLHLEEALIGLNYFTYKLLKEPSDKMFNSLKKVVMESIKILAPIELKNSFLICINFCIQRINEGDEAYQSQIFELYLEGIEKGILLNTGYLNPITFSNVVTIGLRLQKYDRTKHFIEEQGKVLPRRQREDYMAYNLSKYFFSIGSFEKVIDLSYSYKMKEVLLDIQSRILLIQSFFEQSEYELCRSLIDNLKQLLQRKGILAYHSENYSNVASLFKKLVNINIYDKKKVARLKEQIKEKSVLSERKWLLEKIEELT